MYILLSVLFRRCISCFIRENELFFCDVIGGMISEIVYKLLILPTFFTVFAIDWDSAESYLELRSMEGFICWLKRVWLLSMSLLFRLLGDLCERLGLSLFSSLGSAKISRVLFLFLTDSRIFLYRTDRFWLLGTSSFTICWSCLFSCSLAFLSR